MFRRFTRPKINAELYFEFVAKENVSNVAKEYSPDNQTPFLRDGTINTRYELKSKDDCESNYDILMQRIDNLSIKFTNKKLDIKIKIVGEIRGERVEQVFGSLNEYREFLERAHLINPASAHHLGRNSV